MQDRIVLIESNTSGTGRRFASASRSLGIEPLLIAEDPARYPYAAEDAVEVVRHPTGDFNELRLLIETLAGRERIVGIYSSSEYFIEAAAELARARSLPGPDPDAVRLCRNKWLQRQRLSQAGVGLPGFARVLSVDDVAHALSQMELPVVVKPVFGTGSVGVRLCRDRAEVESHAAALLAVQTNERGMPVPREVLIEEYIRWPEFSAEMFNGCLLGITRKHLSNAPYFVETGHDFPVQVPEASRDHVAASLTKAVQSCGMLWGPAHVEFRCQQDSFAIMEINPRLAGGFIPDLICASRGIDLIQATIALATSRTPRLLPTRDAHASIRFLCALSEGAISRISGLEHAASSTGVIGAQMYKHAGDHVGIYHDFRDRIGHVISCGQNERDAASAAGAAIGLIHVEVGQRAQQGL